MVRTILLEKEWLIGMEDPLLSSSDPTRGNLILLFANLFSGTLSRQSLLHSALRARLQVEGVTLHFFNNVLLLDLAFKTSKSVL